MAASGKNVSPIGDHEYRLYKKKLAKNLSTET